VKALSSRPNVAMTIDVGDTPTEAKALLVRGLASVDIVNGVPDEYVAASTKVLGADQFTEFERQVRSMYDQMARISIEPVWVRFFDFGAGRMPSFLTKLTPSRQSARNIAELGLIFHPLRAAAIWCARDALGPAVSLDRPARPASPGACRGRAAGRSPNGDPRRSLSEATGRIPGSSGAPAMDEI